MLQANFTMIYAIHKISVFPKNYQNFKMLLRSVKGCMFLSCHVRVSE